MFPVFDNLFTPKSSTPYDIVLHIQSLNDLTKLGWKITANKNGKIELPKLGSTNKPCLMVGVLGAYNRGKSFMLNQLCKTQFPSGRLLPTEGLSITEARETVGHVVFIDTAGVDTPAHQAELDDRRATEALLREVILQLCPYIIIVLNRLHLSDQIYIREVLEYCAKKPQAERPEIILFHNLLDLEEEQDVHKVIIKEIKGILGAKFTNMLPQTSGRTNSLRMFSSTYNPTNRSPTNLRHFIFAKDGSPAAKAWNRQSLDGIMNIFQMDTPRRRSIDIVDEIIRFINTKLPQLYTFDDELRTDLSELQIVKHETEPYIVFSHQKNLALERRSSIPSTLKVSPKLMYDKRGYLIGIYSEDVGQWQPRYHECDKPESVEIYIELAGFDRNDVDVTVDKKYIIVKGTRDDFTGYRDRSGNNYTQIPIGPFELKIPVYCDINSDAAELDCRNGLFTITCPKAKDHRKTLAKKSAS